MATRRRSAAQGPLVQRRLPLRLRRRRGLGRRVAPREPPELAALGRAQALALQDDRLDLLESGPAFDALAEGRANLLVHRIPFRPVSVPSATDQVPEIERALTEWVRTCGSRQAK